MRISSAIGVALAAALMTTTLFSQSREPAARQMPAGFPGSPQTTSAAYVGSAECRRCHAPIYERWSRTRMANVVVDPKQHPDAVLPDFTKPDPLVKFTLNDVAFVYGSKWKQRYFTKRGNDY